MRNASAVRGATLRNMPEEPQMRVVKVPTIPIHPQLLERYERERVERERLLTIPTLAKLKAAEAEIARRMIGGG